MARRYETNPKHKRGACGTGPPRWFPTKDSLCPDSLDLQTAQELLPEAIDGVDDSHPGGKALFNLHQGEFYKAYPHDEGDTDEAEVTVVWHGYPVRQELVRTQIPARVVRQFVAAGRLTKAEYKKLLGSAQ